LRLNKEAAAGILEVIATLSAEGASGRLDVVAGANEGALLFRHGKLVDARIGHLTGFQAVNALASMRDSRFHFDPTVGVPTFSAISSSERLVLKQFFGIETIEANDYTAPVIADEIDEATVLTTHVASTPIETAAPYQRRSRTPYVIAFALSVLFVAMITGAVVLRNKFREQTSAVSVATNTQPGNTEPVSRPTLAETTVPDTKPETKTTEKPAPAPTATPAPAAPAPAAASAPAAQNLSGNWSVVNTVHSTSLRSFQNLQIGFALSINQTGKTFTAKGHKISENGRRLPASSRTPIELQGVINGDKIEATYSEEGAIRKTNGRFVWQIDRASGALTGVFASTAAHSSGKSTATREL